MRLVAIQWAPLSNQQPKA